MDTILTGGFNTWILVKAFSLVLLGMYLIFSLVIVRQAKLMMDTLKVDSVTLPKTLAYLHLAFAVLVFLTALVIL
jgi:hypothetical protein